MNVDKLLKVQCKSDRLWISDRDGEFIQTDLQGNKLKKIKTRGEDEGYHTVTQDGDLIFTDKNRKAIYKKVQDNKITEFFNTGDWEPYKNINGDICTSDFNKEAVVVVNKSGQHRFSYIGQGSVFCPYGICTDVLGHILVCDEISNSVHLLDQNGQFLSFVFTEKQLVKYPRSLCVDNEKNIYVGQRYSNTLTVYKYLQ
ncbi:tripartite motif-containing protein 2-like [Saccostrea cucullata]|uniref:tripartite motif-containing protein 2-like n=1 Tax=Saccostrea cuccullata TaxID=36930 RepID=UPI002ED0AA9C